MLEAVSRIALEQGIKGYVSVEEHMACGVGACLGCAIKVRSKELRANPPLPPFAKGGRGGFTNSTPTYKMVCKDGPVFPLEEIMW
jgi:dihydroorotate dehydrogenase electron transfer subunit